MVVAGSAPPSGRPLASPSSSISFQLQEEKTRRELGGPLSEWFKSVSNLGGEWGDHGKKFANYVAHPMGGATYAHIYRQNDQSRRELEVGEPGYGGMVLRALAFSAVISLQFELGPLSEASIGNVGMRDPRKMAWGDLVVTPVIGTAWMVGEDLIDEKILKRMDGQQIVWRNTVRFFLNPSRTAANMSRLKWPWYRERDVDSDRRPGGALDVLREVRDRQQIDALMWRYARALDTGDAAVYAAIYTVDGDSGPARTRPRDATR